jgi:hypothetical protein
MEKGENHMTTKTEKYVLGKDVVALIFTKRAWGNRKKADKEKVRSNSDKRMLNVTKKLIDSPEYDAITSFLTATKKWVTDRSVQSVFLDGVYWTKTDIVDDVEDDLIRRQKQLKPLVRALLDVYNQRIGEAKKLLTMEQFRKADYPTREYIAESFGWTRRWIVWGVPENLPSNVRKIAIQEAKKDAEEIAVQITMALREGFRVLIAHAVERMKAKRGEAPKQFRESVLTNITEFIEFFRVRNVTNDSELEKLVAKAKEVLADVDGRDVIVDDPSMRRYVQKEFKEIETTLDGMIEKRPNRRAFNFDED